MSRIQDNPIEAYDHYLRKGDYKKAARSLEHLISQHPKDIELAEEIVHFAVNRTCEPTLARKWLLRLIRMRTFWLDYALLAKIEAGMLIKEYLLRGMARNVLILTPASLVSQWQEEMEMKFGIPFQSTDSPDFTQDPETFWKGPFLIASLGTAKSDRNMPLVLKHFYDLVVVDEAHHLRNRTTKAWKLANQLQKRFMFLLTATPIQNNLIELFNLITLLKPGQFKTEKLFRQEYVARGNLRKPARRERLQELLREVMIRNTRSAIDLKLPKRFATTLRLEPSALEAEIYESVGDRLKAMSLKKPMINILLREAGSSPFALRESLLKLRGDNGFDAIIAMIDRRAFQGRNPHPHLDRIGRRGAKPPVLQYDH